MEHIRLQMTFKLPPTGTRRERVIQIFHRLQEEYGLHYIPKLALFRELQRTGPDVAIGEMVGQGYLVETDFDDNTLIDEDSPVADQ